MSEELSNQPVSGRRAAPKRRARKKKRHTVLRAVLGTAFTLALVTMLSATFVYRQLDGNISSFENEDDILGERPDKETVEGPKEPLNIVLIGSDEADDREGKRSDTTMILHVSADREFAYGVSLPRDAIVDRPDCRVTNEDTGAIETVAGEDTVMFNTAYNAGGALCTVETIEELTGIYVDAVAEIDFRSFENMVDAIGGVEICVPEEIEDTRYNISLPEGRYVATGEQALDYVRERHRLSTNGDVGRMKRQQSFLASMANKIVSAETLTNPGRLYNLADAVTQSITISEDYAGIQQLAGLGSELNGIGLDRIQFVTVPNEEWVEDPNRLIWTDEADDLWQLIRTDQALTAEFLGGAIGAEDPGGSVVTTPPSAAPTTPTDGPTSTATDEPTDEDPVESLTPEEVAAANGLC
ncbi:LCP family protein [Nocardioides alkalitolerans]|uniref:LCP family glycopolymer transferase n=1 Tax=Nocardioides alkalitolerans TaxID=281714 RepID=UPI000694735D|nr:LCP family protein [Nocardioides alkalitolerans]